MDDVRKLIRLMGMDEVARIFFSVRGRQELLPLIRQFSREYYLAGGTAVALHIGHPRSIDCDLFKFSSVNHKKNIDKITGSRLPYEVTWREAGQMNVTLGEVKLT